MRVIPKKGYEYTGSVPADKSATHRAIMLAGVAEGTSLIRGPLISLDTLATLHCMEKLGAGVRLADGEIAVTGTEEFHPDQMLDCGNSGTTMRLLAGLVAGKGVPAVLDGDNSLRGRPMNRVVRPLSLMGADIRTREGHAPLTVLPGKLTGCEIGLEVPSAQVKSAALLAGISADGETTVRFSTVTRDHTERMLAAFGANVVCGRGFVKVSKSRLKARELEIFGDVSSSAYPLALGALLGRAEILGVGVNPTRTGFFEVLERFGAKVSFRNRRSVCGEPVADVSVSRSRLTPLRLDGEIIANVIDELPVVAVLACFCEGASVIGGAGELRLKESDRIRLLAKNLAGLGADVTELPDGLIVRGHGGLPGDPDFTVDPEGDHRIAMSLSVAGLASKSGCRISDFGCVNVSFPDFARVMGMEEEE